MSNSLGSSTVHLTAGSIGESYCDARPYRIGIESAPAYQIATGAGNNHNQIEIELPLE